MKALLQLGCGVRPVTKVEDFDFIRNHDRTKHHDYVDNAWDLNVTPWPWQDAYFDRVIALDVMEHLRIDVQAWLDECWRILKPGGELVLRLPSYNSPVGWRDPTHYRLFAEETFLYWDKRHALYHDYGSFYFAESDKWWTVERVERVNPPTATGDLGFVLRKVTE